MYASGYALDYGFTVALVVASDSVLWCRHTVYGSDKLIELSDFRQIIFGNNMNAIGNLFLHQVRGLNENVDILPNIITMLCGGTIEQFAEQD